jgi:hypothetical protein
MLETLKDLVDWLGNPQRQMTLMWVGGGVVFVVVGIWGALFGFETGGGASIEIKRDNNGVVIGGDAGDVTMPAPSAPKAESK